MPPIVKGGQKGEKELLFGVDRDGPLKTAFWGRGLFLKRSVKRTCKTDKKMRKGGEAYLRKEQAVPREIQLQRLQGAVLGGGAPEEKKSRRKGLPSGELGIVEKIWQSRGHAGWGGWSPVARAQVVSRYQIQMGGGARSAKENRGPINKRWKGGQGRKS